MEPTFQLRAHPIRAALYLLHNPPRERESHDRLTVIRMMAFAAEFHGTDSAVIKAGFGLIPHLPVQHRRLIAQVIGSKSRGPLRYIRTLARRLEEPLKQHAKQSTAEPYMDRCGAADLEARRVAIKPRYPKKHRRTHKLRD